MQQAEGNERSATSRVLRVGVTGHRKLGPASDLITTVEERCQRLLDCLGQLANETGQQLEAYSALAIGADQIFARAALRRGIPLVGVVPFAAYAEDFEGGDRKAYDELLAACARVDRLPHEHRSNQAYFEGGTYVVDQTQVLIAVWDGLPARGFGGTGDVVKYAQAKGKLVLLIDPFGESSAS